MRALQALALAALPCAALASGAQEFTAPGPSCTLNCMRMAADASLPLGNSLASSAARSLGLSPDDARTRAADIVQGYSRLQFENEHRLIGIRAASQLTQAASVLDVPIAGAVLSVVSQQINNAADLIQKTQESDAALLMGASLQHFREQNRAGYEAFMGLDEAQRLALAAGEDGFFLRDGIWQTFDPVAKDEIVRSALTSLTDAQLAETRKRVEGDVQLQSQVDNVKNRVLAIEQVSADLRQEFEAGVTDLREGQIALFSAVELVRQEVKLNGHDIDVLQQAVWGEKSATERVALLRSGFFRRMPEDKRQELEAQLEKAAAVEQVTTYATNTFQTIRSVARIAQALGADSNVVGDADRVVAAGNAAVGLFTAYMSPNPLAVVHALGGAAALFGGGSNPDEERQARIMDKLGAIHKDIVAVRQQVQVLQVDMNRRFDELRADLQKNHNEVMRGQAAIMREIADLGANVSKIVAKDLEKCLNIRDYWKKHSVDSKPYSARAAHFKDSNLDQYKDCRKGIQETLYYRSRSDWGWAHLASGLPNTHDNAIDDKEYRSVQEVRVFERDIYDPAYMATLRHHALADLVSAHGVSAHYAALAAMAVPAITLHEVAMRDQYFRRRVVERRPAALEVATDTPARRPRLALDDALARPLRSDRLIDISDAIRLVTSLMDVMDYPAGEEIELLPHSQLLAMDRPGSYRARDAAHAMNDILLVAAAQEQMLAGTMLLPWLAETLDDGVRFAMPPALPGNDSQSCRPSTEGYDYATALCLMRSNGLLARNAMMALVERRMRARGFKDYRALHVASSVSDPKMLHRVLGDLDLEPEVKEHKGKETITWYVVFGRCHRADHDAAGTLYRACQASAQATFKLPSYDDMTRGTLSFRKGYFDLLRELEAMRNHRLALAVPGDVGLDADDMRFLYAGAVSAAHRLADPSRR